MQKILLFWRRAKAKTERAGREERLLSLVKVVHEIIRPRRKSEVSECDYRHELGLWVEIILLKNGHE